MAFFFNFKIVLAASKQGGQLGRGRAGQGRAGWGEGTGAGAGAGSPKSALGGLGLAPSRIEGKGFRVL